jgi:hypothetical protein
MIGEYIDGIGWEVLCDNLGLLVGYVNGNEDPTIRTIRPNDDDYQVYCQEIFRISNIDGIFIFNGNESTPTNTLIDFAVQESDRVVIEVNETLYNCFLSNTYLNGQFATDLTTLYNTYLTLLP